MANTFSDLDLMYLLEQYPDGMVPEAEIISAVGTYIGTMLERAWARDQFENDVLFTVADAMDLVEEFREALTDLRTRAAMEVMGQVAAPEAFANAWRWLWMKGEHSIALGGLSRATDAALGALDTRDVKSLIESNSPSARAAGVRIAAKVRRVQLPGPEEGVDRPE